MSISYTCSPGVIGEAMHRMKQNNRIADDAGFNFSATEGLRREVSYRDMDFLEHLAYCNEKQIVEDALQFLKEHGIVGTDADYDRSAFLKLRMEVKRKFEAEWRTITPAMERLFYMLSSVRKPQHVFAGGVFWGNAFSWNIGSSCGTGKVYTAQSAVGIDINPDAIAKATRNLARLEGSEHIRFVTSDAIKFAKETNDTYDYVYLDVGISQVEKSLNYDILAALYEKLSPGAWVVTHDTTHPFFRNDFRKYLDFVRNKEYFRESVSFDFDPYGLELSIKV